MNNEAPTTVQYRAKLEIPTAITALSIYCTPFLTMGSQPVTDSSYSDIRPAYAVSQPSYTVNDIRTLYPGTKLESEQMQVPPEAETIKKLIRTSVEFTNRLTFLPANDAVDKEIEKYFSTKQVKSRKLFRKS